MPTPEWAIKIREREKTRTGLPLEVKLIKGNYYLYISTTRWSKEEKKRKKVGKCFAAIKEDGTVTESKKKTVNARSAFEYGNGKLLYELSTDILEPLKRAFPEDYNEILAMAFVKTIQQSPIRLIKTRWEKLFLSHEMEASLSPNILSEKLRNIGMDWASQRDFFHILMKQSKYLIYDLSSIFSYSENLKLAEKGHNADHLYLKQINLALFFSQDKHLPAMLKPIPGSIKDIKSLKHSLEEWDLSSSVAIFDRGFASYEMSDILEEKSINFIMPLRRNFKIINYDLPMNDSFIYRGRGINWIKTPYNDKYIYQFEDVKLRSEEETTFIELICDGKRRQEDLPSERKCFGKISILSNINEDGKTIYLLYKEREEVELAFDSMKNELENDKTYLSNDDSVRGYFFVSFFSLYLYFKILEILRNNNLIGKMSVSELLFELSKVHMIYYSDNTKMLSEIPKKSEKIEKYCEIKLFPNSLRS